MMNPKVEEYKAQYESGFDLTFSGQHVRDICGIHAEINIFEYNNAANHREKAHIILQKGNARYECDMVDRHYWEDCFYPIKLDSRSYLCFRKTLYGFSFLDADTLEEVYDYFPSEVLCGEESFIIACARSMDDLIIFEGCYWASPYSCFAYDHNKKLFVDLSEHCNIYSVDDCKISGDELIIMGTNQNDEKMKAVITLEEIKRLLTQNGKSDFYSRK